MPEQRFADHSEEIVGLLVTTHNTFKREADERKESYQQALQREICNIMNVLGAHHQLSQACRGLLEIQLDLYQRTAHRLGLFQAKDDEVKDAVFAVIPEIAKEIKALQVADVYALFQQRIDPLAAAPANTRPA